MITASGFIRGIKLSIPVIMGYLPVGFAFGILAVQAGLHPMVVGLMSYFVYAGSAQLIAANLLLGGVGPLSIILTTFIVNMRHLLMSAAMTPFIRNWSKPLQAWFSFEMTDETFALNLSRFNSNGVDKSEVLGINIFSHIFWTLGGIAGALFGDVIGDIKPYGLDFALPGMFIALLLPHFKIPRRLLAVLCGAALSLALAMLGAGQLNVAMATVLAAAIAAFIPGREKETDG